MNGQTKGFAEREGDFWAQMHRESLGGIVECIELQAKRDGAELSPWIKWYTAERFPIDCDRHPERYAGGWWVANQTLGDPAITADAILNAGCEIVATFHVWCAPGFDPMTRIVFKPADCPEGS